MELILQKTIVLTLVQWTVFLCIHFWYWRFNFPNLSCLCCQRFFVSWITIYNIDTPLGVWQKYYIQNAGHIIINANNWAVSTCLQVDFAFLASHMGLCKLYWSLPAGFSSDSSIEGPREAMEKQKRKKAQILPIYCSHCIDRFFFQRVPVGLSRSRLEQFLVFSHSQHQPHLPLAGGTVRNGQWSLLWGQVSAWGALLRPQTPSTTSAGLISEPCS